MSWPVLFDHSPLIARLTGERFRPAEVRALFGLSEPAFDAWTTGANSLPLISPKGRGRGGRFFCINDLWTMAIYKRLVALTDAGLPMRAALARFIEERLFAELDLPEVHEFLTWREANPSELISQFKPKLKRTKTDLDWHREAIRARVAIDPFEAPALWWSRDLSRPWFIVIDLDMLAADVAALKSGGKLSPLTVNLWCDIPEGPDLYLPAAALAVNATECLTGIDKRIEKIVTERGWPELVEAD